MMSEKNYSYRFSPPINWIRRSDYEGREYFEGSVVTSDCDHIGVYAQPQHNDWYIRFDIIIGHFIYVVTEYVTGTMTQYRLFRRAILVARRLKKELEAR